MSLNPGLWRMMNRDTIWQNLMEDVLASHKVPQEGGPKQPTPTPIPAKDWVKQHERQHQAEVQRKDPQDAANVEAAHAIRLLARVEQNAGNQESRQHEEDIDARPTPRQTQVVIGEHRQKRQCANAIQCREVAMAGGRRACWRLAKGGGTRAPEGGYTKGGQLLGS